MNELIPEHQVRRPGVASSEFWLSLVAILLPILLPVFESYVGKLPPNAPFAVIGSCLVAVGYALSRGMVKQSRNIASGTQTQNAGTIVNEAPKTEKQLEDEYFYSAGPLKGDSAGPLKGDSAGPLKGDSEVFEDNQNIEVIDGAPNKA